jgi:hypothetical protein
MGVNGEQVVLSVNGNEFEDSAVVEECGAVIKRICLKVTKTETETKREHTKMASLMARSPLLCRECYNQF